MFVTIVLLLALILVGTAGVVAARYRAGQRLVMSMRASFDDRPPTQPDGPAQSRFRTEVTAVG